jgi:hypothetical protein
MNSSLRTICLRLAPAVLLAVAPVLRADDIGALKQQLEQAQQAIQSLQRRIEAMESAQKAAPPPAAAPVAPVSTPIAAPIATQQAPTAAKPEKNNDAQFEVYGFAQMDYVQDFKRVNPAWDDTLRPSRIPTADGTYGTDGQAILSARQSRLGVNARLPIGDETVVTKFEFDLFGVGSDEGQTTIRLRHAYGEWNSILAGQTNSLFMDGDLFPNTIDYWGPSGMVFLRNPQLRWTPVNGDNRFAVAIEKPGTDLDTGNLREIDPSLANTQGDEKIPDLTAQFRTQHDWGHVQLAGILRRIGYETIGTDDNRPRGHETGWGLDLSSNFRFGPKDKLMLGVVYGEGIASYMNDGGVDLAGDNPIGNVEARAVPLTGIVAYYDHYWSEQWSSSIGYSSTQVENLDQQRSDAFEKGEYASVNLLYTPVRNVLMGAEYLWGRRTDNDGAKGEDDRLQISVKYSFSSLDFPN